MFDYINCTFSNLTNLTLTRTRSCKQNASIELDSALELTDPISHVTYFSFSGMSIPAKRKILRYNFLYWVGFRLHWNVCYQYLNIAARYISLQTKIQNFITIGRVLFLCWVNKMNRKDKNRKILTPKL